MSFTDYGLETLGSFIKGDAPGHPNYLAFGAGNQAFIGSMSHLQNEIMRSEITWQWNGKNPQGVILLLTTDAVGSNIQELGLGSGLTLGSNIMSRDLSAIGDKTNSFSTTLKIETRFSRP